MGVLLPVSGVPHDGELQGVPLSVRLYGLTLPVSGDTEPVCCGLPYPPSGDLAPAKSDRVG